MADADALPIEVDDFMVVLDNENGRVILQFVADVSRLRTPVALVLDTPNTPMSLEDEQGMIVAFTRPVNDDEFLALSLAGEVSVALTCPSGQRITRSLNVAVIGKISLTTV
jgi:hypothetical protein